MRFRLLLEKLKIDELLLDKKVIDVEYYSGDWTGGIKSLIIQNKDKQYDNIMVIVNFDVPNDVPNFEKLFESFRQGNTIIIDLLTKRVYVLEPIGFTIDGYKIFRTTFDFIRNIVTTNFKYNRTFADVRFEEYSYVVSNYIDGWIGQGLSIVNGELVNFDISDDVKLSILIKIVKLINIIMSECFDESVYIDVKLTNTYVRILLYSYVDDKFHKDVILPIDEMESFCDIVKEYDIYYKTKYGVVTGHISIEESTINYTRHSIILSTGKKIIVESIYAYIGDNTSSDFYSIYMNRVSSLRTTIGIIDYDNDTRMCFGVRDNSLFVNSSIDEISEFLLCINEVNSDGYIVMSYTGYVFANKMISFLPHSFSFGLTKFSRAFTLEKYKQVKMLYEMFDSLSSKTL